MDISFTSIKQHSIWVFNHEHMNTVEEPLCNGTELVLDQYFEINMKRPPVAGDQIQVYVATEDYKDSDTLLVLQKTGDFGSDYLDMVLFETVWLCPWLQSYFGHAPTELYVKLDPINPALKNFNKNYSNPFNKYLKKDTNGKKDISGIS